MTSMSGGLVAHIKHKITINIGSDAVSGKVLHRGMFLITTYSQTIPSSEAVLLACMYTY